MGKLGRYLRLGPKVLVKKIIGYEEIYTIGIRERGSSDVYKSLPYSTDYWYADPITFKHEGEWYLFTEAYDRKRAIGRIAVSLIDKNGNISTPRIIIAEDYHMSFPYVFEWRGDIYMIPESSDNSSINLYKCVKFPFDWKLVSQFHTTKPVVDTIVVEKNDEKLNLLGSVINENNPLLVSYQKFTIQIAGDELTFREDPDCPVNWNLRDRNAGRPFALNDIIAVPTQESSDTDYGKKVNFRKLGENLVPEETIILSLSTGNVHFDPSIQEENMIGVHTYSQTDDLEIVDLRYYKFSEDTNRRRIEHYIDSRKN